MPCRGVEITPTLVLGSRETVKEAVAAGLGLGIVLSRERGSDPRLRGVPVDDAAMTPGEHLVARPDWRARGAVAAFTDVARQAFA
ncbi:LysR substrate-binding domain-containing protein [Bosea sp. R86505]|uniref:LysR substrate-binding domain-containing protein n=1 Tax=Bosea sp. R86505 TaxID=3101710 RepID=UPI003672CB8C